MAAAEAVAFKAALMISDATAVFFSEHTGLSICRNLALIPSKSFDTLLQDTAKAARDDNARRLSIFNAAGAAGATPEPHRFSGLALEHLRAFRLWAKAREMMDATMVSGAFPGQTLLTYVQLREEIGINQDEDSADIEPCRLMNIQKGWCKFDNKLRAYLRNKVGAASIPMSYLVRDHQEVTPAIRAAEYDSEVERLIACVALDTNKVFYRKDNQRLADKIISLVQDGDCHGLANDPKRSKDGRWMYLEVQKTARVIITSCRFSPKPWSVLPACITIDAVARTLWRNM